MKLSTVTALIGLSLSTICIIVNLFTAKFQFDLSNKLTRELQQYGGEGAATSFFLIITYLGFPVVPLIPLLPLLFFKDKWVPFKVIFLFSIGGYMIGLLKVIYGGPRPWWMELGIKVYGQCSVTDYGRPSGHAFISVYAFLIMFQFYIYEDQAKSFSERITTRIVGMEYEEVDRGSHGSQESEDTSSLILKKKQKLSTLERPQISDWNYRKTIWLIAGIILCILIGISRIYLGAHSFEQIFLGWSYAILLDLVTVYWLDNQTDRLFLYFLDGRHRYHNLKILLLVLASYAVTLTLPLVIMKMTDAARAADKAAWLIEMARQCGKYKEPFPIDSMSLYLCITGTVGYAMVLGLMFAKTNIMITPNSLTLAKLILRKLVAATLFGAIAAVLLLALRSDSYIVDYFVNFNIFLLLTTLCSYLLIPTLFRVLKLSEGFEQVENLDRSTPFLSDDEP